MPSRHLYLEVRAPFLVGHRHGQDAARVFVFLLHLRTIGRFSVLDRNFLALAARADGGAVESWLEPHSDHRSLGSLGLAWRVVAASSRDVLVIEGGLDVVERDAVVECEFGPGPPQ